MDAYFRSNPSVIVSRDKDAIQIYRPFKYIQHEDEEIMKNRKGRDEKETSTPSAGHSDAPSHRVQPSFG